MPATRAVKMSAKETSTIIFSFSLIAFLTIGTTGSNLVYINVQLYYRKTESGSKRLIGVAMSDFEMVSCRKGDQDKKYRRLSVPEKFLRVNHVLGFVLA